MRIIMKCGHIANDKTEEGKPYCAICDCKEIAEYQPILRNRKAKCFVCGKEVKSSFNLCQFEFTPNKEYDTFYCGCGEWEQ